MVPGCYHAEHEVGKSVENGAGRAACKRIMYPLRLPVSHTLQTATFDRPNSARAPASPFPRCIVPERCQRVTCACQRACNRPRSGSSRSPSARNPAPERACQSRARVGGCNVRAAKLSAASSRFPGRKLYLSKCLSLRVGQTDT